MGNRFRTHVIEILKTIENLNVYKDDNIYAYYLTHTHANEKKPVYVIGPYSFHIINALIAFIQYECADIDDTYALWPEEIAEILCALYDCERANTPLKDVDDVYEIDLYINWEEWVGSDVQSISIFKHERLSEMLKELINRIPNYN